jgi:hypothetical protein
MTQSFTYSGWYRIFLDAVPEDEGRVVRPFFWVAICGLASHMVFQYTS